jgi:hypothetical protein
MRGSVSIVTVEAVSESIKHKDADSVTMRAAVLAFIAALLGAVIGGLGTYVAAKAQIDGQAKQSQTDFLRGQREQAYLTYNQKVANCNLAFGNYRDEIATEISRHMTKLPLMPETVGNCLLSVDDASGTVLLIGSQEVMSDARSIGRVLDNYSYDLTSSVSKYNSQGSATESLDEFKSATYTDISSVAAAQRKFFHDATGDVQG